MAATAAGVVVDGLTGVDDLFRQQASFVPVHIVDGSGYASNSNFVHVVDMLDWLDFGHLNDGLSARHRLDDQPVVAAPDLDVLVNDVFVDNGGPGPALSTLAGAGASWGAEEHPTRSQCRQ